MAYDGKLLAKANAALADIKEANRAERERRIAFIHSRYPEIAETDRALSRQMSELVRLAFSGATRSSRSSRRCRTAISVFSEERASALEAHGFARDYLDEIYTCPVCRDTGMDGNRVCSCLKRLYNAEVTKMLGTLPEKRRELRELRPRPLQRRIRHRPGRKPAGVYVGYPRYPASPMRKTSVTTTEISISSARRASARRISACVARVVAGSGFSVCYESCGAAFDIYETKRFSRDSEAGDTAAQWKRMLDCDLMILDDLGNGGRDLRDPERALRTHKHKAHKREKDHNLLKYQNCGHRKRNHTARRSREPH